MGRRNFDRRFIKATNNTPVEYLQRVKIESAKKAFETTRKHINEVMYEVGYSDIKAFREVFRKITGLSPLEYKNKLLFRCCSFPIVSRHQFITAGRSI
ncbi:helix-turn-helix domain-containing protein [Niabella ginsengisoli]|uniref:Helix-turn-helix domain-containing protein n=1 Tax=Niabella ginsengisoli TaxID=522298 RepID=A0ABS9SKK7_9BACT|nr:helix-turn-helix domain-containing protein [Niabella ginsengisoli]MCH5598877.1 helix-turn-helix domain-containing protein [Niabella ginsengisoli]